MTITNHDAINKVRRNGIKSKKEYGIVIDNKGNVINAVSGKNDDIVLLDKKTVEQMKKGSRQGKTYHDYHYHPNNSPPSIDDIRTSYQIKTYEHINAKHTVVGKTRITTFTTGKGDMKEYKKVADGKRRDLDTFANQCIKAKKKPTRSQIFDAIDNSSKKRLTKVGGTYKKLIF